LQFGGAVTLRNSQAHISRNLKENRPDGTFSVLKEGMPWDKGT